MAVSDVAYGISALSTNNYSKAENDELLVREADGKMYYKREDGQIVGHESRDYNRVELSNVLMNTFIKADIDVSDEDFAVYHTIDLSDKVALNNTTRIELDIPDSFVVSEHEKGFFVRFRGSDEVNSIADYTAQIGSAVTDPNKVTLGYEVDGVYKETDIDFNELTYVSLDNATNVLINIKSVQIKNFNRAYSYISYHKLEEMTAMNLGNRRLYIDKMDLITFKDAIIEADGKYTAPLCLKSIVQLKKARKESNSTNGFVFSANEPNHECLWAKIVN